MPIRELRGTRPEDILAFRHRICAILLASKADERLPHSRDRERKTKTATLPCPTLGHVSLCARGHRGARILNHTERLPCTFTTPYDARNGDNAVCCSLLRTTPRRNSRRCPPSSLFAFLCHFLPCVLITWRHATCNSERRPLDLNRSAGLLTDKASQRKDPAGRRPLASKSNARAEAPNGRPDVLRCVPHSASY